MVRMVAVAACLCAVDAVGHGTVHTGIHHHVHEGISKATSHPHLTICFSGHRICTRVVSSAINEAVYSTSATSTSVTSPSGLTGYTATAGINGLVNRHTGTTGIARIIFSHNKFGFYNGIGTLTSTTHRANLGFWLGSSLGRWQGKGRYSYCKDHHSHSDTTAHGKQPQAPQAPP